MVPQRLHLDFIAPPVPRSLHRVLLAVGVLAALAAGAQLVFAWQDFREQKQELAAAAQRGPAPTDAPRRAPAGIAGLQTASTVARDLTAPWADLLRAIESIQNKDVSLYVVEPVAGRQTVRITADARSFDAMLDYLQQLASWSLQDVTLVSHQVQVQQPGMPIRFIVQARWGSAMPAKRPTDAGADPGRAASPVDVARGPR